MAEYAKHLDTTSSCDSDDDFIQKKKKKTGKTSKQTAAKVATPCFYNLANMSKTTARRPDKIDNKRNTNKNTKDNNVADKDNSATKSDTIDYSDTILETHTVDSVEKMNSINITETGGNFFVEYGQ